MLDYGVDERRRLQHLTVGRMLACSAYDIVDVALQNKCYMEYRSPRYGTKINAINTNQNEVIADIHRRYK